MKQLHFQSYTMNPFFAFMFWKYNCLQTELPHFSAVHLTKCRHVLAYVPDLHSCSSFAVTYPSVGHFSCCTAQNFSFVCCLAWLSQFSQSWRVRLEELVKKTIRTKQLLSYNVKSGGFLMSRIFFCPNCHWIVRTLWELSTIKVGLVGLVWLFNSFESILWSMQLLEDPGVDASFPPSTFHSSYVPFTTYSLLSPFQEWLAVKFWPCWSWWELCFVGAKIQLKWFSYSGSCLVAILLLLLHTKS